MAAPVILTQAELDSIKLHLANFILSFQVAVPLTQGQISALDSLGSYITRVTYPSFMTQQHLTSIQGKIDTALGLAPILKLDSTPKSPTQIQQALIKPNVKPHA
jgi:hypothetical protein